MEAPYEVISELADEASQQFVGRWMKLVSTTNWEKGRIISEWREALIDAGAQVHEYSDEAWSRRLGNLSSQHTGRLRRAYTRFAATHQEYAGLYWSHFQAALDWEDAEMWLEGAVQNDWSVAEMRRNRSETLGTAAGADDLDAASEEFDDDAEVVESASEVPRAISPTHGLIADDQEESDESDAGDSESDDDYDSDDGLVSDNDRSIVVPTPAAEHEPESVRPFARLADLPPDLADAFESFKLAILRHKLAGWSEVPREDVVATLRSLEELVTAPS